MACSLKVTPFLSFIVKVDTIPDFVATNPENIAVFQTIAMACRM